MPSLKTILGWALVIMIALAVFHHPAQTGNAVHNLIGLLGQAGNSIATFLSSL